MIKAGYPLIIVLLLFTAAPSFAQPRDVPAGHWSSTAIYELVSRGITQGYPDGTFHGDKLMSRYETAVFLYKLDQNIRLNRAISEKLVEELKMDLEKVKEDVAEYKSGPVEVYKSSGSYAARARFGREVGEKAYAKEIDYRLMYSLEKDFGRDFSAKVSIDTLDSGFGGASRNFSEKMLLIEGGAKINLFGFSGDLAANTGAGKVIRRETNPAFQADDYTVISKPNPTVSFSTVYKGFYISTFYVIRAPDNFGNPYSKEIGGKFGLPKIPLPVLEGTSISLTPRYLYRDQPSATFEARDSRGEIEIVGRPSPKLEWRALFGMRSGIAPDRAYLNVGLDLNDYFNTGTRFSLSARKVGIDYRIANLDKYEFGLINSFDRLILDGTNDVAAKLSQKLTDASEVYIKGEATLDRDFQYGEKFPGTSLYVQEGVLFYIPSGVVLEVFVKDYQVPSGVADAVDPALNRLVLKSTEMVSASLTYAF